MILEQASRKNVPRQFSLPKPEDDAVGSLRGTVPRGSEMVGLSLANLQIQHVDKLAIARQREPSSVVDLRKLREEESETDEPITEHAFSIARDLLRYIPLGMFETIPEPLLAPDGSGGIRIEWLRNNRNVRVVIPSNTERQTIIYHRGVGEPNVKSFSHAGVVQTLRAILFAE